MGKTKEQIKKEQLFRSRHLSFTVEDIRAAATGEAYNAVSYGYMFQAMTTTDYMKKRLEQGKELSDSRHVYPTTADQAYHMQQYLDLAAAAVVDENDEYFFYCHEELSNIANLSQTKWRTFKWRTASVAIVLLILSFLGTNISTESIHMAKDDRREVKAWAKRRLLLSTTRGLLISTTRFALPAQCVSNSINYAR
ncbi:MAG: hypothetical protein SNH63_02585 [Rikenellaceae bacterium]